MSRYSPIKSKVPADNHPADEIVPPGSAPETESPPKITRPARETSGDQFNRVTLTFNEAKNGLQLHFPSKPSDEVRAGLKAAGWRWSFRNGCWYHRDTPANRDFAERFVARLNGAPAAPGLEPEIDPEPPAPVNIIPLPQNNNDRPQIPAWRLRLATIPQP